MRVLILGGYGTFGGRIAATLAGDAGLQLLVAGRDQARAGDFVHTRLPQGRGHEALRLDATSGNLPRELRAIAPDVVIDTAGPFQQRDYSVPRAVLDCGAHGIDLADGRGYVSGFVAALDAQARQAGRLAITGASSVPGLSSAVVDAHLSRFSRLDGIDSAISPGNRTPRGVATTRAILGYVGQPYRLLQDGRWRTVHGWQSLQRMRGDDAAGRWLARCEVPDVDVLPARYPSLRDCDFRAGLELRRMHFGLWLASWAVRAGAIHSMQSWAARLLAISERWRDLGSDIGRMEVRMRGLDHDGRPLRLRWELIAGDGDGPQVPCTAAVVLVRKLLAGELHGSGAMPCCGLFALQEYLDAMRGFAIDSRTEVIAGRA